LEGLHQKPVQNGKNSLRRQKLLRRRRRRRKGEEAEEVE